MDGSIFNAEGKTEVQGLQMTYPRLQGGQSSTGTVCSLDPLWGAVLSPLWLPPLCFLLAQRGCTWCASVSGLERNTMWVSFVICVPFKPCPLWQDGMRHLSMQHLFVPGRAGQMKNVSVTTTFPFLRLLPNRILPAFPLSSLVPLCSKAPPYHKNRKGAVSHLHCSLNVLSWLFPKLFVFNSFSLAAAWRSLSCPGS